MSQLLHPHQCGPNTVKHFNELSVDGIITELSTYVSDLYELFNVLGRTGRHDEADDLAQLK